MQIKIKRLTKTAVLPKRATPGSAGYDIYTDTIEPIVIRPGETIRIRTGLSIEPDTVECAVFIYARSGLASNFGIVPANCVAVIDSDYRGEIMVPLHNFSDYPYEVKPGERIAQMVAAPVFLPQLIETDELSETVRGTGGFGSTGQK